MKTAVFLNGTPPLAETAVCYAGNADTIICADGAASYLKKYGIAVDFAVGDFDSVAEDKAKAILKADGRIIKHPCEKDYTDGQLALSHAVGTVAILGALGGRVDHTLENLRLLARPDTFIVDEQCHIYLHYQSFVISGRTGQTVSLLPYTDTAVIKTSSGLKYPTENLCLKRNDPFVTSGLSNVLKAPEARVTLGSGGILLIINQTV